LTDKFSTPPSKIKIKQMFPQNSPMGARVKPAPVIVNRDTKRIHKYDEILLSTLVTFK
jgi:hypothetical protein